MVGTARSTVMCGRGSGARGRRLWPRATSLAPTEHWPPRPHLLDLAPSFISGTSSSSQIDTVPIRPYLADPPAPLQPLVVDVVVVYSLSRVQLFVTPWTVARQAPLSMGTPSKNTAVRCHSLLQGIFPTKTSNPGLLYCRWILHH